MTSIGMISKTDMIELVDDAIKDIEAIRDKHRKLPPRASIVDSMYHKGVVEGAKESLKRIESLRKMLEVY